MADVLTATELDVLREIAVGEPDTMLSARPPRTFAGLRDRGFITIHYGAGGEHDYVVLTPAGRDFLGMTTP